MTELKFQGSIIKDIKLLSVAKAIKNIKKKETLVTSIIATIALLFSTVGSFSVPADMIATTFFGSMVGASISCVTVFILADKAKTKIHQKKAEAVRHLNELIEQLRQVNVYTNIRELEFAQVASERQPAILINDITFRDECLQYRTLEGIAPIGENGDEIPPFSWALLNLNEQPKTKKKVLPGNNQ